MPPMSISTYIKHDLLDRLQSGRPLPAKMTLESVADLYQVSVTPVRAAVNELVAEGVIKKGKNRRLTLVRRSLASSGEAEKSVSTPPQPPPDLLDIVANDFVQLSLGGEPVQLREEATAEKFRVSRSAIRNVFHHLAGSGLIEHVPRRGWILRPFRQEDMRAFLEIREVLELKALELAKPRLVDEDLRRLLDGNRFPESEEDRPRIDNTLHAYIIGKAGNPYIKDFLDRHGRYYDILFDWEDEDRETAIETVRQHREILEAMLARDWPAARKALSWHIQWNHPILSKVMHRHLSQQDRSVRSDEEGVS